MKRFSFITLQGAADFMSRLFLRGLVLFLLPLCTPSLSADTGCGDFEVGADFFYWKPCINDAHYAGRSDVDLYDREYPYTVKGKYKFVDPDWDAGFRAYASVANGWMGGEVNFIFTYFETDEKASVSSDVPNSIVFSTGHPIEIALGQDAKTKWSLDYKSYDLFVGYPIDLACERCLTIVPYSGVRFINLCQTRREQLVGQGVFSFFEEYNGEEEEEEKEDFLYTNKRKVDYWGVGPSVGVRTSYDLCEGFRVFGNFGASLLVGESDWSNRFIKETIPGENGLEDETIFSITAKTDDECFCIPGWQFQTGMSYSGCFFDAQVDLHAGYEYVQWVNAPAFLDHQTTLVGSPALSSKAQSSVTFHGFFAGITFQF